MRPPNSSRGPDGLKKGPWTPEEDQKLIDYIQTHGQGRWQSLPEKADLNRCGKSCRLRWTNYLRPDIKRGNFTPEEEQAIIDLHSVLGNKWSMIATRLPGRTDNEIKNFWNTHLRKRLLRSGIDPTTHQPITYPTLPASTDANRLMNGPLEDLANIRILCNILQLLKANPLPTSSGGSELALNHFGRLVNGSASNPLQVPPMETVEPLWHKEFQPINFDTYGTMPKLVDSKNNGITSSASRSFIPEVLSGCNQVHSDIELAQLPSCKQAFASNSYDDVWGEVIDDEASGSCSWKDAFNELFLASTL